MCLWSLGGSSCTYFGVKFSHFTIVICQLLSDLSIRGVFTFLHLQGVLTACPRCLHSAPLSVQFIIACDKVAELHGELL